MITSDKQYAASKEQLTMLQESLSVENDKDIPEIIKNASKEQLKSLISDIQAEIDEYEKLKSIKLEELEIHSIQDLMVTPIRYRIVSHMSVDAFSRKVGVSARQIHRYEAENYSNVNTSTLTKILEKLDVSLDGHVSS
ncbi:MAG: helix-turn-helix domain-containing protein [Flavobacteriaceae bacterium]|nr:helix-turn-helix domain-containing protein [Flavobacteriaceae bacterium]